MAYAKSGRSVSRRPPFHHGTRGRGSAMALEVGGLASAFRRELGSGLRGQVISSGERGYDTARLVFNGMIDRHPLAVIRPLDASDVVRCISFARRHDLPLSVRGGGHSVAGHAVRDDAVMLDLSGMKALRVDPETRTVRAEPGLTLGEFDARHAGVRVGDDARSRVGDRDRRADTRRRVGLAQRPSWTGVRQPDSRRRGDRRRTARQGQRGRRTRTCSGASEAAAATLGSSPHSSTNFIRSSAFWPAVCRTR